MDDILIIFDQNKTKEKAIINHENNTDQHLEFKISGKNNAINYLDLSVHGNMNNIDLNIHRKPAYADITIQFSSSHSHEHKLAAFTYYINRMLTLPITKQAEIQEWNMIQWLKIMDSQNT